MDAAIHLKLVLIGDKKTGKTTFCNYIQFGLEYLDFADFWTNDGTSFFQKSFIYNGKNFIFSFRDTPGEQTFDALTKFFISDAQIIFIFYDYYNKKTFERAKYLFSFSKEFCNQMDIVVVLIANKYDLHIDSKQKSNIVPDEHALKFADKNNILFSHLSISEQYSDGVIELFQKTIKEYIKKKKIRI